MNDPKPENIRGLKASTHSFEHSIRWDYMLLGGVALFVAWKLLGGVAIGASSGESKDDLDGEPIEFSETTNTPGFAYGGD